VRPSRRTALVWVGIAVTLFFTYLSVRNAHLEDVREALRDANMLWLVPAFVVLAVAVLLRAVRWRSLYTPSSRPPLGSVTCALLVGYFFNNVLPLRAGEAARIVALHSYSGTSRVESVGTSALERVYDVLVLLLLLFVLLPWLPDVRWLDAAAVFAALVAGIVVVSALVLARWGARPVHFALRPLHRLPRLHAERVEAGAENLAQGLVGLRHPTVALPAVFWTALSWIVVGLSAWLVMRGFDLGVSLSPVAGIFVVITINLALILPSSPAAVGVFEAATILALDAYGVSESAALSYALVLHALNFLPFVAVGAVLVRDLGWHARGPVSP
jgi:glycosyltransferase 2 family protein